MCPGNFFFQIFFLSAQNPCHQQSHLNLIGKKLKFYGGFKESQIPHTHTHTSMNIQLIYMQTQLPYMHRYGQNTHANASEGGGGGPGHLCPHPPPNSNISP